MPKFRKKPVVIEAVQFDGTPGHAESMINWIGFGARWFAKPSSDECFVEIKTLEGVMRADKGDWIIKGVQGEFYPVKPDIFSATYEPVD